MHVKWVSRRARRSLLACVSPMCSCSARMVSPSGKKTAAFWRVCVCVCVCVSEKDER